VAGLSRPSSKAELRCAQGMDFFGGKRALTDEALQFEEHVAAAEDDRIIFLSDVWLDKPATHDRLRAIFDGVHCTHAFAIYPCALILHVH